MKRWRLMESQKRLRRASIEHAETEQRHWKLKPERPVMAQDFAVPSTYRTAGTLLIKQSFH